MKFQTISNATFIVVIVSIFVYYYSPIDPVVLDDLPVVPFMENHDLAEAEHVFENKILGPEHIAISVSGQLYTGLLDGRIITFDQNEKSFKNFSRIGKDLPICGQLGSGKICGRPMGMLFSDAKFFKDYINRDIKENEEVLIVVDAYKGLLLFDNDGNFQVLLSKVNGRNITFANSLAVSKEGIIYFTETSSKYDYDTIVYEVLEGINRGSLISFDPKSKNVELLLTDYPMANGLALVDNDNSILISASSKLTINKFHLKGSKKGQLEQFIVLPGNPDNIIKTYVPEWKKEILIIGISTTSTSMDRILFKFPTLRKFIACLPLSLLMNSMPSYGMIAIVSLDGTILRLLQDPTGGTSYLSGGYLSDKTLYLGSWVNPYIAKIPFSRVLELIKEGNHI